MPNPNLATIDQLNVGKICIDRGVWNFLCRSSIRIIHWTLFSAVI